MKVNPLATTDSYKYSQYAQLPPGTEYLSSYIEARGVSAPFNQGRYAWDKHVFFGLQPFAMDFLTKPLVTKQSINRMNRRVKQHGLPYNLEGFDYLLTQHCGYMPLRVQALPEGSVVPLGTPLVQVVNTDPKCAWLTDFVETSLLRAVWYPSTVATQSYHIKRILRDYLMETVGNCDGIDFMLHDFGARGVSSSESAQLGGMAHLTSFMGTDNFEALEAAEFYYGEDMAGFSVPASQHSTMTSWGGEPGEILAMENMIDKFGSGIFSIVSDSYDIYRAVEEKYGQTLAERIKALGDSGGRLVVRPDSGDPNTVPVEVVDQLMISFGHTQTGKDFSKLPPYVGVLQGDGINQFSIHNILENAKRHGHAASNYVFGMGGALLQGVNRDTLKFAMKASAAQINGEWRDVFKDPVTDKGKTSKKGRQAVYTLEDGSIEVDREDAYRKMSGILDGYGSNLLEDVVVNGELKRYQSFEDIRARIEA